LKGAKRTVNKARHAEEGNIEDGKHDIPLKLFWGINECYAEDGSKEAIFTRAYGMHNWNPAC
jgi:hypothetical protein